MERVAPAGDVYQAGTLSGNPLAVAAGLRDARRSSMPPPTTGLRRSPTAWPEGLVEAAGDHPVTVTAVPGLVTPFFSAEPIADFAGASACDLDAYARFCRALLERGIYPPPSQFEAWFVSLAHDEAAIERTCEAAAAAFEAAFS